MCGICGVVDFDAPVARETLERMSATLRHRGPDDDGFESRPPAALAFRRLSIIDLAGSHQPMSNEDETLWLVFNGEIYNFAALRTDLEARGHRFKTAGDGESILHLYEEHGLGFVDRLNGMFAFALWDAPRQRMVLVRDRLGIKPLYYRVRGRRLSFASETKALLAVADPSPAVDREAIAAYMAYSSIPGRRTGFESIAKLLPGEMAVFDASGLALRTWWDLSFHPTRSWTEADAIEAVDAALAGAVRGQMISDVPIGVFLSGGVDSGLVAAIMARHAGAAVKSFTIGYGREGAYLNETDYARRVAARYGMDHHEILVTPADLLGRIETVAWHLDEPCGDPAAFLTLALSEFTRRHVTVALSGLGADEIFCGYRRYAALRWQGAWRKLPPFVRRRVVRPLVDLLPESRTSRVGDFGRLLRKFLRSTGDDARSTWARTISYLPEYDGPMFGGALCDIRRDDYVAAAFEEIWGRVAGLDDEVDRAAYLDIKMYMVDQLLLLQDKMSMAVSLEARVPFLDHTLVELAAGIPSRLKMAGGELKSLLKKVAERHLPRECIYRPKKGFAAPVDVWLRGPLRERVEEALSPATVRARGFFEPDFVVWMKRAFYERGEDLSVPIYQALLLEVWLQTHERARASAASASPRAAPVA